MHTPYKRVLFGALVQCHHMTLIVACKKYSLHIYTTISYSLRLRYEVAFLTIIQTAVKSLLLARSLKGKNFHPLPSNGFELHWHRLMRAFNWKIFLIMKKKKKERSQINNKNLSILHSNQENTILKKQTRKIYFLSATPEDVTLM